MKSQRRNLNPAAEAIAAMWLWGEEYSKQGCGSMDFYDALDESKKRLCGDLVEKIQVASKRWSRP